MKLGNGSAPHLDLDEIDRSILKILQEDCKISLARIGAQVGLSAPSVIDRIKKLETSGIIKGYHAALDAKLLGLDVTTFVGVSVDHPTLLHRCAAELSALEGVLEIHHVTGRHSLIVKAKTRNTATLEALINRIGSTPGVARTETMVVLSTHTEGAPLPLADGTDAAASSPIPVAPLRAAKRSRRRADDSGAALAHDSTEKEGN